MNRNGRTGQTWASRRILVLCSLVGAAIGSLLVGGCSQAGLLQSDNGAAPPQAPSVVPSRTIPAVDQDLTQIVASLTPPADGVGISRHDWARERVLGNTDFASLVHSVAAQQGGSKSEIRESLRAFDAVYRSKGARVTYDLILASQWRLQNDVATAIDRRLVRLVSAATVLSLLFDPGTSGLGGEWALSSAKQTGGVAEYVYTLEGSPSLRIRFRMKTDRFGRLRVAEWLNYAEVKRRLVGTDLGAFM